MISLNLYLILPISHTQEGSKIKRDFTSKCVNLKRKSKCYQTTMFLGTDQTSDNQIISDNFAKIFQEFKKVIIMLKGI